jgi:hypothetical protein
MGGTQFRRCSCGYDGRSYGHIGIGGRRRIKGPEGYASDRQRLVLYHLSSIYLSFLLFCPSGHCCDVISRNETICLEPCPWPDLQMAHHIGYCFMPRHTEPFVFLAALSGTTIGPQEWESRSLVSAISRLQSRDGRAPARWTRCSSSTRFHILWRTKWPGQQDIAYTRLLHTPVDLLSLLLISVAPLVPPPCFKKRRDQLPPHHSLEVSPRLDHVQPLLTRISVALRHVRHVR